MHRFTTILAAIVLIGCGGEPTTSYCEAVCDWAVTCAGTERTVDAAALEADCLAATRSADEGCANAEEGKINPVTREAVEGCVSAITAASDAGECEPFVGTIDELKAGTAPTACAATGDDVQAVFTAAQESVLETGDQLCQRFTDTFCGRLDECIISDLGEIPQAVTDQIGTPFEICVQKLDFQTQSCQTNALYQEEESLSDLNETRQVARECLRDFGTAECSVLLAGEVPELCAGSFSSAEDAVAVGLALLEVAEEVNAAVEEYNGTGTGR